MKQLRCALYPRVSTEEQFLNGLSLDAQHKDLLDYAQRMGYIIVGVYPDEGISARKPVSKRPALLRLLEDVKQNKIDIILVTKLDRWFRNIKEYQITEEILRQHNCYWKTIYEDYDTSTANGQMIVNIMLAVAQNECDRDSERIKAVFRHKVMNGEHLTGAAPFGYICVNKKLQKDPETEHIVDDIFQHYFSSFSKRKTVFYILEKYKDHPKCPTKYQINRILSKEQYAGIYNGIKNYYPAYITEDQYQIICTHSDSKTYVNSHQPYVFTGLLLCPHCGLAMHGFTKKQMRKDGSYSTYKRYRCAKKYSDHNGACITEHVIEEYLKDNLCKELNRKIIDLKITAARKNVSGKEQLIKIQSEINRLNLLFQKGRITEEYYDSEYERLSKKEAELKEPISLIDQIERYEQLKMNFSGNWYDLYDRLDIEHKNAFWKRIIKNIYIDENTHKICGFSFIFEV